LCPVALTEAKVVPPLLLSNPFYSTLDHSTPALHVLDRECNFIYLVVKELFLGSPNDGLEFLPVLKVA